MGNRIGDPALADRLSRALRGEVLFDPFSRGRYSTDASIYQIEPIGVTLPRDAEDVEAAIATAREEGVPVLPRGAGSSQSGQTVNEAVVMDTSRYMNRLLEVDVERGTATVQPGIVLDRLNKELKPTGWHFPVDVSTSNVATIGGMTGNNSAGGRSIKYGIMVHNVLEIEAVLADGLRLLLGEVAENSGSSRVAELAAAMRAEHGDGLVRSEFHEAMYGAPLVRAFEAVKDAFDPTGLFNPGRIVRPPRMDDRRLFRYKPEYARMPVDTALDWSDWGGFLGAVEMCNNNGACRKADVGVMCPSYLATRDEKDLTRGRANSLRLALSGQLGPGALVSDDMKDVMDLCVSCKGCRRECPTGVDMARMKIEFLNQWHKCHGTTIREKLTAYLPRYAHWASRLAPVLNLRNRSPLLAAVAERVTGLSARRTLPLWRRDSYRALPRRQGQRGDVILLVDCFSRYFEPENARAARTVLEAGGYTVLEPDRTRPLCCGRTFLSAGLVAQAREEMSRLVDAVGADARRGIPIVGIEPSCLLTLRDELTAVLKGNVVDAVAGRAVLFEEFLAREARTGKLNLAFRNDDPREAHLHGHCHQKAFGTMPDVVAALRLVPGLAVKQIESSCCGMAGSFGYEPEHEEVSVRMAERDLLPAVRKAPREALIVADGTSCRHQIADNTDRIAVHAARVLEAALAL